MENNMQLFLQKAKEAIRKRASGNHFERSRNQQYLNKKWILVFFDLINSIIRKIGLQIVGVVKLVEFNINNTFKLSIEQEHNNEDNDLRKCMKILRAKDLSFISDRNYTRFINEAGVENVLPSIGTIVNIRKRINKHFTISSNDYGNLIV